MKFPNKIVSYNESVLGRINPILEKLKIQDIDVVELYKQCQQCFATLEDYIEVLDCLFAINAIFLLRGDNKEGVLHYAL